MNKLGVNVVVTFAHAFDSYMVHFSQARNYTLNIFYAGEFFLVVELLHEFMKTADNLKIPKVSVVLQIVVSQICLGT